MDRVFLDANVLFSAAYRDDSGLLRLWRQPNIELVTSELAVIEAFRNLESRARRQRLERLLVSVHITAETERCRVEASGLPDKDQPILESAVGAGCTHLVTGDLRHFGHLLGTTIAGVRVLTPAHYFGERLETLR